MNIEVQSRQANFWVITGMVGVRGEKKTVDRLGFDPSIEPRYLAKFSRETRRGQLKIEMSTALEELFLSQYSHEYMLRDGKIVDKETGILAGCLTAENEYEARAIDKIEKQLAAGSMLVVNISAENKRFDYPDNMVDFWVKGEGEKVTVLRLKVDMTWNELLEFNKMIGGTSESREEVLANPLAVEKYCLADLIRYLSISKSKDGLTVALVEEIVSTLVNRFEREFGEKIYVDSELITRMYVAARLEVEDYKEKPVSSNKSFDIGLARMRNYLYGVLKTERKVGGGCGGSSLGGQFASEGIIIVKSIDGISFKKGSTEGLTYCKKCGCWYSGEKCPICE